MSKAKTKEETCIALASALMDFIDLIASENQQEASSQRMYTFAEVGKLLGRSRETIRQWALDGDFGELIHAGKSTIITQEGLDYFFKEHRGPSPWRERKPRQPRTVMTGGGAVERI